MKAFAYALEQAATKTEVVVPPVIPIFYPMQPVHIASPPTPVRSAIKNPTYQHNPPVPPTMLQTQQSSPTTKVVHRPRPSEVTGIAITMFIFDIFYLLDGISLMISYQVLS
ncbi:MAG: hypothetical protein WCD86_22530, partial [Ktedonobacteraceae bacterium]